MRKCKRRHRNAFTGVEISLFIADTLPDGEIIPSDSLVATTFSAINTGNYSFEDVSPGAYILVETQPDFYLDKEDRDFSITQEDPDGDDRSEGADNNIPVLLSPAEEDCENDFIEDPMVGTISGEVTDEEGTPMENVAITLFADANNDELPDGPPNSSTTTNAQGAYSFEGIEPGTYIIFETQPTRYNSISDYDESTGGEDLDGDDRNDGPDNDIPVELMPAEIDSSNNFRNGRPGNICGEVKEDTGMPLGNVEIRLYTADTLPGGRVVASGFMVAITYSDGDTGDYQFDSITPGAYVVVENATRFL